MKQILGSVTITLALSVPACTIHQSEGPRQPLAYQQSQPLGEGKPIQRPSRAQPKPVPKGERPQTDPVPKRREGGNDGGQGDTGEPKRRVEPRELTAQERADLERVRKARLEQGDEPGARSRGRGRGAARTGEPADEPLSEDPAERVEQLLARIEDRTQSVLVPLSQLQRVIERWRTLGLRHRVPADELAAATALVLETGRIRVPERVPEHAEDEFRRALQQLRDADERLQQLERQARTAELTVLSLGREADQALLKLEAGAPRARGRAAQGSRLEQLEKARLEQRLEQRVKQALDELRAVPEQVRTLTWRLEHPYGKARSLRQRGSSTATPKA